VNVSAEGGSIKVDQADIPTYPYSLTFQDGTEVNLEAVTATGFYFSHWNGDISGSANPITILMSCDKQITANFSAINKPFNWYIIASIIGGLVLIIVLVCRLIAKNKLYTIVNGTKHIGRLILHPYSILFSRLAFGGTFIFAGIVKLPYVDTLIWEINQYHILSNNLAMVYGRALPYLEIILGIFLVLGIFLIISASIGGLIVLSFTIAKISALAQGSDIDICPCFGLAVPLLAIYSLVINFLLLAMAIQLFLYKGKFLAIDALLATITGNNKKFRDEH